MSQTAWTINSIGVNDYRFNISTVDGWDSYPGRRGTNVEVPFLDGTLAQPVKYYDEKEFALAVTIFGCNTSGVVTHTNGAWAHIRENTSIMMGALYGEGSLISVRRADPAYPGSGTVTLEAMCEVVDTIPVRLERNMGPLTRLMVIRFKMPTPFWRVLPEKTGQTTPSVSNGGNAPVTDMVITFTGGTNPVLTNTTTSESITITDTMATPVIVDVGARTVTQSGSPADGLITPGTDNWMKFVPGTNALTLSSGAVSIDFYDKEF